MNKTRVLLADDHTIVAEGLRSLLEGDFELVGTVNDGRAMLEAARSLKPDVIVADISIKQQIRQGLKIYALLAGKEESARSRVGRSAAQSRLANQGCIDRVRLFWGDNLHKLSGKLSCRVAIVRV